MNDREPQPITVELPFPLSVNNLFKNVRGKGRVRTPEYDAWRTRAAIAIAKSHLRPVAGPVDVVIELVPPDRRRRDADNYGKAVLDALVRPRLIERDDNAIVKSTHIIWREQGPPCRVTVSPASDVGAQ